MTGCEFVFNNVDLLYYHLHKISLKKGGSYVDSPKWLKNKRAIINPKYNDDKCFQYALTFALNQQNIKNNQESLSKINLFINQYNWKKIYFPSHKKDGEKFELNDKSVALNILLVPYNTEKTRLGYKLKHNFKRKNQVVLLMITDGKKWRYLAVKKLSALLRGVTSNHKGDFYCLNCFH